MLNNRQKPKDKPNSESCCSNALANDFYVKEMHTLLCCTTLLKTNCVTLAKSKQEFASLINLEDKQMRLLFLLHWYCIFAINKEISQH